MMRGSQAIGIDTNPVNSIAITLANANVNSLKAFEMLINAFKETLCEDMLKVYEEAKEHFSYSAITMVEPRNE